MVKLSITLSIKHTIMVIFNKQIYVEKKDRSNKISPRIWPMISAKYFYYCVESPN